MNKKIVLSILSGIMLALSFPPFRTGFLAYLALIPFFILLDQQTLRQAAGWGYLTGLVFYSATVYWIGVITLPGCIGTLLIMPLYFSLYSLLHVLVLKRLGNDGYLFLPFLWISVEYIQSLSEFSFPWNHLGYTQTYYLPLIQHAAVTSVYGVSFWIVLLNVLFLYLYRCRKNPDLRYKIAVVLAVLILLPLVHGLVQMKNKGVDETLNVTLIQGNIDPLDKWEGDIYQNNYQRYETLSRRTLETCKSDLWVWPETALPFYLRLNRTYRNRLQHFVDSTQIPLLTGTIDYDYDSLGASMHYNSVHLYEPETFSVQRYDKIKLVPFSERVPYGNAFPFKYLKHVLYDYGTGNYSMGDSVYVFKWQSQSSIASATSVLKTGVAVCYESVYPEHVRAYVKKGAQFITVITNDAWFGKSSGPYQHKQIAVMRAVENRRAVARCANTGISCFIDPYGRVSEQTSLFTQAAISSPVQLRESLTFFTRLGPVLPRFSCIVTVLLLLFSGFRRFV